MAQHHSPVKHYEHERLRALRSYQMLDTPRERAFDLLAEGAARLYRAPFALVTLVDERRQFHKATFGTEVREFPIAVSFCRYTIESDEVLVVPDTTRDSRFDSNPLVTHTPRLRFYAGAPILTGDGYRLGAVCILDTAPRDASSLDTSVLAHFAMLAGVVLDHRRSGSTKPLEFPAYRAPRN